VIKVRARPLLLRACPVSAPVRRLARLWRDVLSGKPETITTRIEHAKRVIAPARRIRVIGPGASRSDSNAAKRMLIFSHYGVGSAAIIIWARQCEDEAYSTGRTGLNGGIKQIVAPRCNVALIDHSNRTNLASVQMRSNSESRTASARIRIVSRSHDRI